MIVYISGYHFKSLDKMLNDNYLSYFYRNAPRVMDVTDVHFQVSCNRVSDFY